MRLLFLYPEEWTGRRAREVHVLSTCAALAEAGVDITLVTAGGEQELHHHLSEVADATQLEGLHLVVLSRTLGPVQSTAIFSRNFNHWMRGRRAFDLGYTLHLKGGPILAHAGIRYGFEAHGISTQTPQIAARQKLLHKVEAQVLASAELLVATNMPLALALHAWFGLTQDIAIVPCAGRPPLHESIAAPEGPFVYCGSIADANELAVMVQAASDAEAPLRIIGGTEGEWRLAREQFAAGKIEWQPHVSLSELPEALSGARAGLIPTNPDVASGEFACPMKLFDYARCGLPVISTSLPALQGLHVGSWCTQIPSPARVSWKEAFKNFRYDAAEAEAARVWSADHTWATRAELLLQAFSPFGH